MSFRFDIRFERSIAFSSCRFMHDAPAAVNSAFVNTGLDDYKLIQPEWLRRLSPGDAIENHCRSKLPIPDAD